MVSSVPKTSDARLELVDDCVPQMKRTDAMPEAVLGQAVLGGLDQARVVGEPEVVVGAEVEDVRTGAEVDLGTLRAVDDALGLVEAVGADLIDDTVQMGEEALARRGLGLAALFDGGCGILVHDDSVAVPGDWKPRAGLDSGKARGRSPPRPEAATAAGRTPAPWRRRTVMPGSGAIQLERLAALRRAGGGGERTSVEEFSAVSHESCTTLMTKPIATHLHRHVGLDAQQAGGHRDQQQRAPATPEAPHAASADTGHSSSAVGKSVAMPRGVRRGDAITEIVIAAPAMLIVAPSGIEIE